MKAYFYGTQGNFFFQDIDSKENSSFYQGLTYIENNTLHKTLNKIKLKNEYIYYIEFFNGYIKIETNKEYKKIINYLIKNHIKHETKYTNTYIARKYTKTEIKELITKIKCKYLTIIFNKNLDIIYNTEELILNFDIKPIYEFSKFGKNYNIEQKDNNIKINYNNSTTNYNQNIKIETTQKAEILNNWTLEKYLIENRRSKSDEMKQSFTRDLLKFSNIGELSIILNLKKTNTIYSKETLNKMYNTTFPIDKTFTLNNIEKLYNDNNFYAGFPWFFQNWARDTLISIYYLRPYLKNTIYKKITLNYLYLIKEENPLSLSNITNFESKLKSYDSIFWLYKNLIDNLKIYTKEEQKIIISKALKIVKSIKIDHNNMIYNNPKETWMDTEYKDDGRSGYALEIQLGYLMILEFLKNNGYKLTNKINNIKQALKKFTENKYIIDSINDKEYNSNIRPNFIIGGIFYPKFIEKNILKTHKTISDNLITESGLTSISKQSKLYSKFYTGENNISYHRGDSWLFVNNLCKKLLKDIDQNFFKETINHITNTNKSFIENGVYGALNEVSSAEIKTIDGCIIQLWSMATYL